MSVPLPVRVVAKPWGRDVLPAPFTAPPGERIGEIWFEPPAALDRLLVKYIFTSEALSVQVHPSDGQRFGHGKEECWLVIDAQPGASLGIGFDAPLDKAAMRAAALDGSIEQLLAWHSVKPGDFFYIPANTVHAIGAGISLIEVQQNSDITYRLYDYGRPRELHLDDGIAVADGGVYDADLHSALAQTGHQTLVDGPYFRLDQLDGAVPVDVQERFGDIALLVIPRSEGVRVGGEDAKVGSCVLADSLGQLALDPGARCLIAQPT